MRKSGGTDKNGDRPRRFDDTIVLIFQEVLDPQTVCPITSDIR